MSHGTAWVRSRKTVQALALLGFVGLFLIARRDGLNGDLANLAMRLDPLLALGSSLAGRTIVVGAAVAIPTIILTVLFGRAWCGWLCPLGTALDMTPSRSTRKPPLVPESWRKAKYVLLAVIVGAAFLGNQTLLFFDPLAIFFRTLTTAIWPALDQIVAAIEDVLFQVPALEEPTTSLDTFIRPLFLPLEPVSYQDAFLVAAFFVGLLSLNALAPRFWCRYLCPLGGFLGLISRIAIFRRRVSTESCTPCKLCSAACPTGTIDPARGYASDPAECTVCMSCVADCRRGAVTFKPALAMPEGRPYDPGRRQVLLALGTAAVGVALFRSDLLSKRESPFLIRPPGSREANPDPVALTSCTRCNECVRVCPTGAIQPAVFQAGLQGLGTPVIVPRLGYCDYACNACGQICPTMAIPLLSLEEKQQQVIGKAYIDVNRCIAWSDHSQCIVCEEMCPLPQKAIQLERQDVWEPGGGTYSLQLPHVVRDWCIGCGICEYRCPVSGDSAIRVYIPPLTAPF